ncbi:Sec-independent protein translocase protein TatB [Vibrio aerogenes CECT 7868]|uniref:Sec-independent protein translocase protein TatB n=1 Tax=Vibrio aerogenes CECT 7868 TaxID=1216006 RepID=A0A1M5ZF89_9VIBR|nr:Sec-independent protein translocase protein TatB [Vibrio aerogenes]SHI22908.1 Sec-independent protein translocase protein TatB [Vibrio aerogenes CECT 7868]
MFDIGFWELVLIFVVALVVLGPERMPSAIRSVGRFVRTARQMANSVKDELNRELELNQIQKDLQDAEQTIRKKASEFESSVNQVKETVDDAVEREKKALTSGAESVPDTSATEKKPES